MAEESKERGLVEYQSRDGQLIKLTFDSVRRYLVSGNRDLVTDQEIVMYMGTCKARGLNPFKRDCYLVKYNQEPAATIVSIDYFRSRARAQEDCQGWESGVIVENGEQIIERKGSFMRPGDSLLGGWFRARPIGWAVDFEWSVNLEPFIKKKASGDVTKFWAEDNQPQMIAKVVESQGLRRLWPDEFQGLYVDDDRVADARDVTEFNPPLAMPGEVQKHGVDQNSSAEKAIGNDSGGSTRGGSESEDTHGSSGASQTRTDTRNEKRDKPDRKAEALAWVADAEEAEIMDSKAAGLSSRLKGLSQSDQLVVCSAYNRRRAAIVEDLRKAGAE